MATDCFRWASNDEAVVYRRDARHGAHTREPPRALHPVRSFPLARTGPSFVGATRFTLFRPIPLPLSLSLTPFLSFFLFPQKSLKHSFMAGGERNAAGIPPEA